MAQVPAPEKRIKKYATAANADNRHGVVWSPEEDARVKSQFAQGMTIESIAEGVLRTPKAVELRLARYAAEEIVEDPQPNKITAAASKWRVTESMVKNNLKKLAPREKHTVKKADLEARIELLEQQVRALQDIIATSKM